MNPHVGKQLSPVSFSISDRIIEDYATGLNLDVGTSIHLPSMIATDADNSYFREISYDYQHGHLWMRQEWELLHPLQAGMTYAVTGEITDIYQRRNRNVVKYRVDLKDAEEQLVVSSYHHQSFLREKLTSETMEFRDPNKKPGVRKFHVPEGVEFGGSSYAISKEMCGVFFHGDANYHTDKDSANQLGFEDVVVGGRMTMAYVGHEIEKHFGEKWWSTGRMDLKFTNPVWCDDNITVKGVVPTSQSDMDRTEVFVWLEKEDGTVAIVAQASAAR